MAVRGTNVRSEVCDAGCFCLESLIIMRHVSCIIHHTSCVMCHVSCVMCVMCNLKFSFMCHLSCLICHLSCVICHVSCVISCHLKFRVIWHFVPFDILCHLTFCVIWHFVPFEILCHLTFRVILFIIVKVIKAFMFKLLSRTGVFSKSGRAYSHRAVSRIELLRS